MEVIDEKGRLFGVVNVVDALVLLLVVAVVGAGIALVAGGGGSPDDGTANESDPTNESGPAPTRYATVSYTAPLESEAANLDGNDTLSPVEGNESYDVADVYRSFTPGGSVHVLAKTEYRGEFEADNETVYGGQSAPLTTGSYRVNANVHAIDLTESSIATRQVPVVLTAEVSSSVARTIEEGQEATIANETVATVESVRRNATNGSDDERRIWVGVELTAQDREPVPAFDGQALRVDNRVTIVTDAVVVRGRLYEVGTTDVSNRSTP